MFVGESTHTLDPKHRVFVPKRFQDELPRDEAGHRNAVLSRGFEGCLILYSEEGFREASAKLRTHNFVGAEQRKMQRMFFSNAHKCQLDSSGRLVLPERLRTLAGLKKEVTFVGVFERAEIWDKDAWAKFQDENDGDFDQLDGVLHTEGGAGGSGA
ncbi:MAG: division/cell wall cluster transcriptional repressor MraZ [Planctomycetota bacterium]